MAGFETILSLIFVVAGAGLSVLAIRQFIERRAFLRNSAQTTGVVLRFDERPAEDGSSYFPIVQFTTPSGREVTFESEMGSTEASVKIGDSVPVRYQRDRPEIAEVGSMLALWGQTLLFGVLGVSFLFVGLGVLIGWLPVGRTNPR